MSVDMRLISIKDGGRFAISWLAGTNPKALRSNTHRTHIYGLDVPKVCKDLMQCIKRKNNSISFRILFRLCFGTIKIFSEQVQHLYNVTLNFVCFNTFFLKQYSRKRLSSTAMGGNSKKRRMGSVDSVDITNLLMESECYDEYSEEKFEFPQEISSANEKRRTTSTCIRIKEITIRQISWDCPPPDEEGAFGEASQDEKNMLLYEISGREDESTSEYSSIAQKRKSPAGSNERPEKRPCLEGILDSTLEEVRCAPSSVIEESILEFNNDYRSQSVAESQTTIQDNYENKDMTIEPSFPYQQMDIDQCQPQCNALPVGPIDLPVYVNEAPAAQEIRLQTRKRPRSHVVTDRYTKLPKIDLEYCRYHIWENCLNPGKKEHIVSVASSVPVTTLQREPARRSKLLGSLKKNFKTVQRQDADAKNRLLLLEEILGDNFETFRSEFKLATTRKGKSNARIEQRGSHNVEEIPTFFNADVYIENKDLNNNCAESYECPGRDRISENTVTLKCSLEKIDVNKINFEFPNDLANQRSNWGKEGVLRKLLSLWKTTGHHISMNALIAGASRINAALAFHTLLDLAGQQYVDIIKDDHNSIKFINIGQEMIRKINKLCR